MQFLVQQHLGSETQLAVQDAVPVQWVQWVQWVPGMPMVSARALALREQRKLLHLQDFGSAQCSSALGLAGE